MEMIHVADGRTNSRTLAIIAISFSIDRVFALHHDVMAEGEKVRGYTITHVGTGLGVFCGITRIGDAERALDTLQYKYGKLFRGLRFESAKSPRVLRIRDAIKPLAQSLPLLYTPDYWKWNT